MIGITPGRGRGLPARRCRLAARAVSGSGGRDRGGHRAQHARARSLCIGKFEARRAGALLRRLLQLGAHPEFADFIRHSPAAEAAAGLMRSKSAQVFHDHVSSRSRARQGDSLASGCALLLHRRRADGELLDPVDPVEEANLRLVAGSHRGPSFVLPTRWLVGTKFFIPIRTNISRCPIPAKTLADIARGRVADAAGRCRRFSTTRRCMARAATSPRAAAAPFRCAGSAMTHVYANRPGGTSPPFPGHGMEAGQRLRADWFPVVWQG